MKSLNIVIGIILYGSILVACSKDGQQGPIGPKGEQGIQGPVGQVGADGQDGEDGLDGEQGFQGEQGETGTANVIYSDWFTLGFPDEIESTVNTLRSISAPDVTEQIVANGVVLVYARFDASALVPRLLPYSVFSQQQYYVPGFRAPTPSSPSGRVSVTIWSIDNSPIGNPIFDEYRYVIIPGGIPASGKSLGSDYSKMNYREICAHFNIPE